MPTRKQRRRRLKERRHEYEYVYVDEEGHEVEVDEAELEPARPAKADGRSKPKPKPSKVDQRGRTIRAVPPPSWGRVWRRVLIFAPLMYVLFTLTNSSVPVELRLAYTIGYTLLFIPFLYWMDRLMYRRYLQRTGQAPDRPARRSGR